MILGMSIPTFTLLHVILSLIGIASGLVAILAMTRSRLLPGWTLVFLLMTMLTSVTGYFFPVDKILPSHIVGAMSLAVLAVAVVALYRYNATGGNWRWIYAVSAVISLYLNVFVLVVQGFLKIAPLKALAPTQSEPPFVIAQGVAFLAFIVIGYFAVRRFHPEVAQHKLRPA
jgi:hypothetical protein